MMTTILECIEGTAVEDFTDVEMHELEMRHIFEGNWVFLAHESEIPDNNDYFGT
jgi:phenylpropionate dioxygenase-like ring-hydroxylating dioxygenase large terminal subunit